MRGIAAAEAGAVPAAHEKDRKMGEGDGRPL